MGPEPSPWRTIIVLADAHIQEFLALDRIGATLGGEAAQRVQERALRLVAEIDELCPRRPRWPINWPPPPPRPPWLNEEMTAPELLLFGARFLAASDHLEDRKLQDAVSSLGEKALGLSMRG
jgi:hypothetical protein